MDARADEVAERLRGLADPVRLRLLGLLARGDCPVSSLASALDIGQSLVSFHLTVLREAGLVATERVGRFTYARLVPRAIGGLFDQVAEVVAPEGQATVPAMATERRVVFACVRNAGRSQMAAAFFNQLAPAGLHAVSAGSRPADHVHPDVVAAMAEVGVDLSRAHPKPLTDELAAGAELLVTMGSHPAACPSVPVRRQDWPLADPAGRPMAEVRAIRDQVREHVVVLLAELCQPDTDLALTADERALVHRVLGELSARFGPLLGAARLEGVVREEVLRRPAGGTEVAAPEGARHARERAEQRLRALAQAEGRQAKQVPEVLFVCVRNAGRSQIAAALAERLAGGRVHAWSAGSHPAGQVHDEAVAVMAELGIDLSRTVPRPWTNELVRAADVVVTMGCGDDCPVFPGVRYLDWDVPDPAGRPLDEARRIRDDLQRRVKALLDELTD